MLNLGKGKSAMSIRCIYSLYLPLFVALVLLPTAGFAQSGQHARLLTSALESVARGQCPSDIMSPLLLGTCQNQMPKMGQDISSKGKISGADFIGVQQTPMGPAEVYRVKFPSSQMIWMINVGPDGKILVFWSPGG